jgi:transmembrane sensor
VISHRTQTARESAAFWHERLQHDTVSENTRRAFGSWLAESQEHRSAYAEMEQAWKLLRSEGQHPEVLALRRETRLRCRHAHRRGRFSPRWAAVAAGVLVTVGVVALFASGGIGTRSLLPDAVYQTKVGERLSLTLADGSRVTLDTQSQLQLAYTAQERGVRLIRGQAMFKVAKDKSRPFVVAAGNRRFVAVGTAFDVSVDPLQIKVTMVEGTVRVESAAKAVSRSGEETPRALMTITAGDQLIVDRQQVDRVYGVDPKQATSWLRWQLVFDNTPLDTAVAELNRYSTTQIKLADPELAHVRLSGTFTANRPELFVEAITTYYPIAVVHRDERLVVLKAL